MDVAAIEGWYGLGVFVFVGAGAMISVGNGFLHEHGPKTGHVDMWIAVRNTVERRASGPSLYHSCAIYEESTISSSSRLC